MDRKHSAAAILDRFLTRMKEEQQVPPEVQTALLHLLEEGLWIEAAAVDAAIAGEQEIGKA
jgi:hypothetical protein